MSDENKTALDASTASACGADTSTVLPEKVLFTIICEQVSNEIVPKTGVAATLVAVEAVTEILLSKIAQPAIMRL